MNNANKSIKQVVSNIDNNVMTPMLERLYFYNMRYSEDNELKGDVSIIARGANSVMAKEAAQVRRNEFLAATANPIDMQIMGIDGRATLLREASKSLDMNPDDIVPPREKMRVAQQITNMMQQGMMPMQQAAMGGPQGSPTQNQQMLMNEAPIEDNFSSAGA
jgi:hypothetical protein